MNRYTTERMQLVHSRFINSLLSHSYSSFSLYLLQTRTQLQAITEWNKWQFDDTVNRAISSGLLHKCELHEEEHACDVYTLKSTAVSNQLLFICYFITITTPLFQYIMFSIFILLSSLDL